MERKHFLRNSLGLLSTATLIDACKKTDVTGSGGSSSASITALNCAGATLSAATAATAYSGNAVVPYTGGNAVAYTGGSAIASTGVTGLTATLQSGTLANGSGNLIYLITGTPATSGTANFALSFGGQTCSLSLTVNAAGSGGGGGTTSCVLAPTETEGPYPYPGGEITNPLNRSDVTGGQTGVALTLNFTIVNTNNSCAALSGYRVDIWACNRRGYYSGYANQPGVDGTLSYVGATWLRGYQLTDANGKVTFTTIYPGWYASRATHFHFEIFNGTTLVKTGQLTMPESISDAVHVLTNPQYNGTVNTTRNASDSVFGNSATDLANQTMALTGSIAAGYVATHVIGVAV